jgi:hypothetical protein
MKKPNYSSQTLPAGKKEDLTICSLQEIHLVDKNKHWLRVEG